MFKPAIKWSCLLLFLLSMIPSGARIDGGQSSYGTAKLGPNWWSISDTDFVTQYGKLAVGSQAQQSQFAWMAFARANQQVAFGTNPQKLSQWELWPSDLDTFSPNVPRFEAAKKIRTRPHLQPVQQLRMFSPHAIPAAVNPFPQAGQEVTRNPLSYNYIMDNHLNTQQGIATFLGKQGAKIEFPLGAIETKAFWVRGAIGGAYQFGGFSLTALHLMVKVKPTPSNPFTDDSPSWFWTTFELKSNKGLAAAQKLITYGDVLPTGEAEKLMKQAGLGATPFTNYVSNGQQIQFFDSKNKTIILGNTQLEWPFAVPPSQGPHHLEELVVVLPFLSRASIRQSQRQRHERIQFHSPRWTTHGKCLTACRLSIVRFCLGIGSGSVECNHEGRSFAAHEGKAACLTLAPITKTNSLRSLGDPW
jgi:hypothetical protein